MATVEKKIGCNFNTLFFQTSSSVKLKKTICFFNTLLFTVFFFLQQVCAQEVFVQPPSKKITSFSFVLLTGGIVIVKAQLDDFADTLNFVLDTGSGGISLDSTTCDDLMLKTKMTNLVIRGIAGMKTVAFTYNHTLHFPGLDIKNLDFHINDYYLLTSVYGLKIDGIIGYSFLKNYIVAIDYEKQQLNIFSRGTFKYTRGGLLLHPKFTTLPEQDAMIKDNRAVNSTFYFDTGAGMCMLLSDDFVKDSSLFKSNRKLYTTQAEGLGGKKIMKITVTKEVKIGPYAFRKVPVYVFDDEYNVTAYPTLGGLLGNDLMRRFNVVLNYPSEEIYIKPNRFYTDSFDYSYTGLGIYLINRNIEVGDIMENSPAQKAGFHVGDIILAVENDFSGNLQSYRILLQDTKTTLRIVVLRDGKPEVINLRVQSIL
jgi:hypothetical protein